MSKKNDVLTASVCFIQTHRTLRIRIPDNLLRGPEYDGHLEAVDRLAVAISPIPRDGGSDGRIDAADGELDGVAVAAGDRHYLGVALSRRNSPR